MRQTGLQSAQKKLHSSQNRTEQNRTEQNRARDKVKIQVSTDFVTTFGPGVKNIKFDFDLSLKGRLKTPENRREI
jgi:hypothetical protein